MQDDKQNTKTTVEDLRNHLQTTTDAKIGSVVENLQRELTTNLLKCLMMVSKTTMDLLKTTLKMVLTHFVTDFLTEQ